MAIPQTPSPLANIIAAKTYNAAWFSGATKEAQITNAIAAAVKDGASYVYVPGNMLPYTASLVTFNTAVKMIREGSFGTVFDIMAYGAAGDGVTDDTAAAQGALAGAQASTGRGYVYFPEPAVGYALSATLNVTAADIFFIGDGTASVITALNANFNLITLASTAHRFRATGLWFKGAATLSSTSQWAIFTGAFAAPDDVLIDACYFGSLVSAGASLNNAIKIDGGNRWRIHHCTIAYLQGAVSPTSGYGILCGTHNKAIFSDNHFYGSNGHGRHAIYLSGGCLYCDVHHNYVEAFTEEAFPIYALSAQTANIGNRIHHNIIINGGQLTSGSAGISITGKCQRNTVAHNYIDGFQGWGIIVVLANNTPASNLDQNIISGNFVRNVAWGGISLEGSSNSQVLDNSIFDVSTASVGTYPGIDMRVDPGFATVNTNAVIRNNICRGANLRSGIWIPDAGHTGTILEDNDFNCGPGGVARVDNGGGSVIVGKGNTFGLAKASGNNGDASVTIMYSRDAEVERFASALTANRTVTLSATNAINGAEFTIVRTGLGAFTLDVGPGLKVIPAGTAAFVDVLYDSTVGGWILKRYGAL